jgi:predicted dehydrogenase
MNMNLTPEEKEIGKQNFYAAIGSPYTRREFLKDSLTATLVAGGSLGAFYYGYQSIKDPLRVGVIGTGDEGNVLIGAMNPSYLQVVAVADIRPYSVYRAFHGEVAQPARPGLMSVYGWKTQQEAEKHVKVYRGDYRDLLKDPNVEAVVIALPLHLHAKVAIEAMLAGKHVLTEKLMGRTVAQCKEMARKAEETNLILAVGHQRHYNVLYDNAVDTIERNLLGDIHYIRAQWHRVKDTWKPGLPPGTRKLAPGAKPEKGEPDLLKTQTSWKRRLDEAKKAKDSEEIDLWTKKLAQLDQQIKDVADAAKYDYRNVDVKDPAGNVHYQAPPLEELIRWRLWARTGAGVMAELGSHQLDAASIFIAAAHAAAAKGAKEHRLIHPLSVSAVANRNLFDWDREIEDHLTCLIEFPAPGYNEKDALGRQRTITVSYASINGNGFGGYGECVFGTKGTLLLEEEKQALLYPTESDTSVVSTKIEVKKKPDKDAVLDTQASPGAAQAAAAGAAGLGADVSRGYREELEHWAWCIRQYDPKKEKPKHLPRCRPEVALKDAVIALTTNVAAQKRQAIKFDEAWFDYKSDATPDDSKIDLSQYKAP